LLSALYRVFEFQVKEGTIPRNILRDFPIDLGKRLKRSRGVTEDHARLIVEEAKETLIRFLEREGDYEERNYKGNNLLSLVNFYACMCFLMATGCRPEEAGGLLVTSIRRFDRPPPDRPDIWADVLINRRYTSADKHQPGTKDGGEDGFRVVPIGKSVVRALDLVERYWQCKRLALEDFADDRRSPYLLAKAINRRALRYFKTLKAPLERRDHGMMFVSNRGNPCCATTLAHPFESLQRRIGLVKKDEEGRILIGRRGLPRHLYTLYDARHMVSTWNSHRMPVQVAASATGHSPETYLNTYVHQTPHDQAIVARSLGELERFLFDDGSEDDAAINLRQRLLTP
jgi:hypothetical protein